MSHTKCVCLEAMREISRLGFTVLIKSTADRPLSQTGLTGSCVDCGVRYTLVPTTVASAA